MHTAHLWSGDVALLASATFGKERASGWQAVRFAKPVPVKAKTTYIASYHTDTGHYAGDNGFFTDKGVDQGPLHALADGDGGGNGVYKYGASAFPDQSYRGSNYWVDVYFKPGGTPTADAGTPPTDPGTPEMDAGPPGSDAGPPPSSSGGFVVQGRRFPNSDTTGVPAGTVLSKYTGPCTIQTAGVVIDAKEVDCYLRILAKNVVIKNSKINGGVYADYNDNVGSFTITDSDVFAGNGAGTGIGDAHFTATRVEVTGGTRSINCYANCTVKDSYVHGQYHDTSGVHHESGYVCGYWGPITSFDINAPGAVWTNDIFDDGKPVAPAN